MQQWANGIFCNPRLHPIRVPGMENKLHEYEVLFHARFLRHESKHLHHQKFRLQSFYCSPYQCFFSEVALTILLTSAMLITGKNLANNKNAVKNNPKVNMY